MTRAESDYYAFMGFSSPASREGLRHYPPYFADAPGEVLELGSGRGEFLDVLREAGGAGRGVDLDPGMVEQAVSAGHSVVLGDAVAYLSEAAPASLGGVFCAHLLEHLPSERVAQVYEAAARALRPGGTFVAVVPNAACLSVMGYDFWRDPTHVRFYDPMVLAFFAERAGLAVAETGGNPRNHPGPPPQLRPAAPDPQPPLGALPVATDPDAAHLIATLDSRLQAVQHQVGALQQAYDRLLDQLYPPNEVYVVARRPGSDHEDMQT